MIILLSKNLKGEEKEKIVNASYEVYPTIPVFIDYKKPIWRLLSTKKGLDFIYQKNIGDNIVNADVEATSKINEFLMAELGPSYLFQLYKTRLISKQGDVNLRNIRIVDNVGDENYELFAQYSSIEPVILITNIQTENKVENIKTLFMETVSYQATIDELNKLKEGIEVSKEDLIKELKKEKEESSWKSSIPKIGNKEKECKSALEEEIEERAREPLNVQMVEELIGEIAEAA